MHKKRILVMTSVVSLMVCILSACNKTTTTSTSSLSNSEKNIQEHAINIGNKVASWQLNHLEEFDYLDERYHKSSSSPLWWIQAAFYIGLTEWADTSNDNNILQHIQAIAAENDFKIDERRPLHADDHAIAQTYLWLAQKSKENKPYQHVQKIFDQIIESQPKVTLEWIKTDEKIPGYHNPCQLRWCWSDALFMSPRVWLQLTNITGDTKYFEYGDREFWATVDYLFDKNHNLFYRDSNYFDMKTANGEPVFWSRGNGWVFAALPLIIEALPDNHPSKSKYIELFKAHAKGLIAQQTSAGYWPSSLKDAKQFDMPETSGTGFITYGLAWGVNNAVLTDAKSKQAALKGWNALTQAIAKDGRVNWVQQVGASPDTVKQADTQFYGVGAVLLAASEMSRWKE